MNNEVEVEEKPNKKNKIPQVTFSSKVETRKRGQFWKYNQEKRNILGT